MHTKMQKRCATVYILKNGTSVTNWTIHFLVQTLEPSNSLQESLCLPPLSSSPTIGFHIDYQYLDFPTPHSCIHVMIVDGPIGTQATQRVAKADAALGHRYPP